MCNLVWCGVCGAVPVGPGLRRTMTVRRRAHWVGFLAFAAGVSGWNIVLPKMASTPSSSAHSRSVTSTAQMVPGTPAVDRRQHGRHRSSVLRNLHGMGSRHTSRCTSSSSDTMEQGEVLGKDAPNADDVEPEPRPFPKVGDVVRYMGKWENEISLGEVRQLQRVEATGEWRAYVLGLEPIGDDQYARKKNRKSKAEDLTTLRPVRGFYVRSVDGFKVIQNSETGEPRYISDGYELEGFELPKVEIDPVKFAADLESYEDLKRRLVKDTAIFGAVGALLAFEVFGADRGLLVALGAVASVGYVVLLEKTADDVASGKRDILTKLKGDARFAMPVLLIATIALKNYITNPDAVKLLNLIPKDDFATAMLGFVAPSRLPLLYREVRSSLKGDELLDMLPGSVGQGRQILRSMRDSGAAAAESEETTIAPSLTRIIVVSGPSCLGKTTLVNKILAEDDRLAKPAWCTTRPLRSAEVEGEDFIFVKQVKFEESERNGAFLETYRDDSGESYGLRIEDVLAVSERGKVCIVDAARPLVNALMGVADVALIGVWVSLDSIEAIEDRIRTTLTSGAGAKDSPDLDSDVRGMVRQAVVDIEFGVMSGVFDFTVINNSDEQESMETIRRAVEFATTA